MFFGDQFHFVAVRKHSDQKKLRGGIGLFQHNLIILLLSLPFCQEFESLDGQIIYFVSYISACVELLAFLPIPLLSLITEMQGWIYTLKRKAIFPRCLFFPFNDSQASP